jgi:hypothetical protein
VQSFIGGEEHWIVAIALADRNPAIWSISWMTILTVAIKVDVFLGLELTVCEQDEILADRPDVEHHREYDVDGLRFTVRPKYDQGGVAERHAVPTGNGFSEGFPGFGDRTPLEFCRSHIVVDCYRSMTRSLTSAETLDKVPVTIIGRCGHEESSEKS